jgi:ferrochelatase
MTRWGLLLLNLGTPDGTSVREVRRYLRQFLGDPRVIDVNPVLRSFLLYGIFLPFRAPKSAEAYRAIWTDQGSPLVTNGRALAEKVAARLGGEVPVELAMRYQNPSVADALDRLRGQGVDHVVVFPLFPQYSSAANGSALEEVYSAASRKWNVPDLQVVPPYFDHPAFIQAWADVARPVLEEHRPDRVVMSYHGLPERHLQKSDESGGNHCLVSSDCCDRLVDANRNCYRAHCAATSRALAQALGLAEGSWEMTFQSRLGRDPWIRPYTDHRIHQLALDGVARVAVLSPAFTADCLETLEELAIRAAEDFRAAGGEELRLVPSLNAGDGWADAVVRLCREGSALGAVLDRPKAQRPALDPATAQEDAASAR